MIIIRSYKFGKIGANWDYSHRFNKRIEIIRTGSTSELNIIRTGSTSELNIIRTGSTSEWILFAPVQQANCYYSHRFNKRIVIIRTGSTSELFLIGFAKHVKEKHSFSLIILSYLVCLCFYKTQTPHLFTQTHMNKFRYFLYLFFYKL